MSNVVEKVVRVVLASEALVRQVSISGIVNDLKQFFFV